MAQLIHHTFYTEFIFSVVLKEKKICYADFGSIHLERFSELFAFGIHPDVLTMQSCEWTNGHTKFGLIQINFCTAGSIR